MLLSGFVFDQQKTGEERKGKQRWGLGTHSVIKQVPCKNKAET